MDKATKDRVILEEQELATKREGLRTFLYGDVYPTLEQKQQELLSQQFQHMGSYLSVLRERISLF